MHMADALLSPGVGGAMWAATAVTTVYCARKVHEEADDRKVPLMGVLGAFVFAAQMINFSIPGTGSSGHLGGGLLLALLLGPHAAFLTIASVLVVQALFFADGGLLALGANIFNMGVFPCFVAYPLVFRPLAGKDPSPGRLTLASVAAAVVALQLGAFGVVLETVFSGISDLPFSKFVLLMQPIHLAIGVVEGFVTAAVVNFARKAEPGLLGGHTPQTSGGYRKLLVGLGVAALLVGGALSWFASAHPDGLEWSIAGVTGSEELEAPSDGIHGTLARIQEKLAFLPDYGFKDAGESEGAAAPEAETWPAVDPGTSVSGIVGGVITLAVAAAIGLLLRRRSRAHARAT
ncbi:energy-coupling factor ABC transporter permease [Deferrisoma camini]|uniref:energy-coupling factor ABC transporter permease n=1 Tax=Deferrisoma camini TaxID=1035120 RepID=UPI00046CBEF4